jgi:hypothetical protein
VVIIGSSKVCAVKELLTSIQEDEERLFLRGGVNPGCSGRAGFSTACVSLPSIGSFTALPERSKPPMPATDNNIAAADATNAAVTANTIVDLRFNDQMSTLLLIKHNYLRCSGSHSYNHF